jgi:MATE family multidrug resistance protein
MDASMAHPEQDDRPLAELLRLALPTVAQMASYTLMQFLDTWMLSHVGDRITPPTAAANSGILAFALISMGMGVMWVVNTLVSQAYGRKDFPACGQYLWQGVWFALIFSLLPLPLLPAAPRAFAFFGHESALANDEATYLQIVVALAVLKLVGTAFEQFLMAIDRASAVMLATMIGVAANVVAAWALIFGHLGSASMGVAGAAWAQNIGVGVEAVVAVAFALSPTIRSRFNVLDWRLRFRQMRTLLKVGVPSGIQVVAEVLAWSAWGNIVMAIFGTRAMAGMNFVFRYMAVSFMPAWGVSTAVTALVGRYIGRRQPDVAMQRAQLGFKVSAVYMLACAAFFIVFRRQLISLFADDPQVLAIGSMMLIFAAVYQLFDAMYIVYYGALRGAGDTFVPAIMTAVLCWSITVLGGYAIARFVPQLGPAGPWYVASAYGAILGLWMYARFARGGWRAINLERATESDTVTNLNVAMES